MKHHTPLIEGQCRCLEIQGINADALLISKQNGNIEFIKSNKGHPSLTFRFFVFLFNHLRRFRGFTRFGIGVFLKKRLFKIISKEYRIIEFSGIYDSKLIDYTRIIKSKGKYVTITLWDHYFRDWQEELYKLCDVINVGNYLMKDDFLSVFPQFTNKIAMAPFGLSQLEMLNDMLEGKESIDTSFISKKAKGKVIITIGYSGRAWHQHFYMIDAIEKLPDELKNRIFMLFPMTYANSDQHYNAYLLERIRRTGIPYQILKQHLSLRQNLSMRILSDVVMNCQVDDGLSASIQEHLMAGSVLIAGDWLPYKLFREKGAYIHTVSLNDFSTTLCDVLTNLEKEKCKCHINRHVIYKQSSWNYKGEELQNVYRSLL